MIDYEVSKEKGGQYYAHPAGHPEQPIKGSYGDKKKGYQICLAPMRHDR